MSKAFWIGYTLVGMSTIAALATGGYFLMKNLNKKDKGYTNISKRESPEKIENAKKDYGERWEAVYKWTNGIRCQTETDIKRKEETQEFSPPSGECTSEWMKKHQNRLEEKISLKLKIKNKYLGEENKVKTGEIEEGKKEVLKGILEKSGGCKMEEKE